MASKSSCLLLRAVRDVHFCPNRSMSKRKLPYFRIYNQRKNKKRSELDIQHLLHSKSEAMLEGKAATTATSANGNKKSSWLGSKERGRSLKTTELMVGIFAVVSMLGGYFGLRWIASNAPKFKEDSQTEEAA